MYSIRKPKQADREGIPNGHEPIEENNHNLDTLNTDVLNAVFIYLTLSDFLKASVVCKRFNIIFSNHPQFYNKISLLIEEQGIYTKDLKNISDDYIYVHDVKYLNKIPFLSKVKQIKFIPEWLLYDEEKFEQLSSLKHITSVRIWSEEYVQAENEKNNLVTVKFFEKFDNLTHFDCILMCAEENQIYQILDGVSRSNIQSISLFDEYADFLLNMNRIIPCDKVTSLHIKQMRFESFVTFLKCFPNLTKLNIEDIEIANDSNQNIFRLPCNMKELFISCKWPDIEIMNFFLQKNIFTDCNILTLKIYLDGFEQSDKFDLFTNFIANHSKWIQNIRSFGCCSIDEVTTLKKHNFKQLKNIWCHNDYYTADSISKFTQICNQNNFQHIGANNEQYQHRLKEILLKLGNIEVMKIIATKQRNAEPITQSQLFACCQDLKILCGKPLKMMYFVRQLEKHGCLRNDTSGYLTIPFSNGVIKNVLENI